MKSGLAKAEASRNCGTLSGASASAHALAPPTAASFGGRLSEGEKEICLSGILHRERQQLTAGYFFLAGACLAAAAACFFLRSALVALTSFWLVFFWFDFGDLSPMIIDFLLRYWLACGIVVSPQAMAFYLARG